jgi:hypothetical protein
MATWDNRTTQYVSSGKYNSVAQWAATTAYTAGVSLVRQLAAPAFAAERVFLCIQSGTSGGTEPTWGTTTGAITTTDGTVHWLEVTGCAALNGDVANTPKWANGGGGGRPPAASQTVTDAAGTHAFICTVSGTTGGTEPTWNTTAVGNTTTDGTVTWMYIGTAATLTKWAAPHARVSVAISSNWVSNNGFGQVTLIHVGNSHNENSGASNSLTWSMGANEGGTGSVHITCVNEAGNVPPQSSDITTGATATAGGNSQSVNIAGYFRMTGITLALSGTGNTQMNLSTDQNSDVEYVNCTFVMGSTNAGCTLQMPGRLHGKSVFRNCTVTFGAGGQQMNMSGPVRWYGGSIGKTGTQLTNQLFIQSDCCDMLFKGVDFSNVLASTSAYLMSMSGNSGNEQVRFEDCILPTSVNASVAHIFSHANGNGWLELIRCGSEFEYARYNGNGSVVASSQAARTGGATDSVTHYGWIITTDATYVNPWTNYLECPPVVSWNTATGSPAFTCDVYGISWDAALPTNKEVWLEIDSEVDAGDTKSKRTVNRVTDIFTTPTSWSADTSHWDSGASARLNTHAYSVGDLIADPQGNGRLYRCTVAGTSNGSVPAGYATAVDGTAVTDGTATFKAGFRFIMTQAISAAQVGNVTVTVCFGKAGSLVYAIDPQVVV